MTFLDDLRETVSDSIFTEDIQSSATLASLVSPTTDKWGDETASYSAGTSINVVPFVNVTNRVSYQPFGDQQEGDVDFVIKYDTTVTARDKITWQSDPYFIAEVDHNAFIGGGLIVQIIRCRRMRNA
jgi:hypothetical protein